MSALFPDDPPLPSARTIYRHYGSGKSVCLIPEPLESSNGHPGTCNTNISPDILTRKTYKYASIKVMASSPLQQEIIKFKVPVIQQILSCSYRIVIQATSALDVADQLTSYIIHPQNLKEPLVLVKVWNLSAYGYSNNNSCTKY
jgi:hypothetical protein